MIITKLHIKKFRSFYEKDFKLGSKITAIAGLNATGKSTLLALLGHCGEYKKQKTLFQTSFRTDLSEIIKFSPNHDTKIPLIGTLYFENIAEGQEDAFPKELSYRSTWQKGPRYRIIPKRTATRNESKLSWPTLYLGLSRLYPIGESTGINEKKIPNDFDEIDKTMLFSEYQEILSLNDIPTEFKAASLEETSKKTATGINTITYDYICNSAGQDNLGQIIMAIISFRKLKMKMEDNWNGGLLLIDEMDATLHPIAQNRLVNFLYKQSKEIGIQVIFTTHSLSLLEYINSKTQHNVPEAMNNFELIYLSTANDDLTVFQNPEYEVIYNDMMVTYDILAINSKKVAVFSEDGEARYFINKILESYLNRLNLLDVSLGNEQLLKLLISDFYNFQKYLFVFDGDVTEEKIKAYAKRHSLDKFKNIIRLPGNKRPEEEIWDYISNLPSEHPFWEGSFLTGRTKRNIIENGPYSTDYSGYTEERDKYKKWFNKNILMVDDAVPFWLNDNKEKINIFIDSFIETFNNVAKLKHIPKITMAKSLNS